MVNAVKFLLFISLYISTQVFANVTATIDKNPVIAGESIVLDVVADESLDNNAFDSSALLKDFIVGRTSVSSQTSMINFKTSYTTRWQTVLIARNAGNYTIPAFEINGQKTTEISLKVLPPNTNNKNQQQDLFIEAKVSNNDVYVQQQFTLQVKLYFASELKRGSLTEPNLSGATITQVGKDKEKVEILNGRRFRVIERNYAINPQQSGEFILSSPMFSGEVVKTSTRRSSFLSFGESTPVSVLGKEISIKVKPIPTSFQGQWLPSELLSIDEEWQPKDKQFKVGEPITRTVTLTAAGLSEEQLPKLTIPIPKGLKIYPDQAKLHTSVNNTKLISQKVQNFAIVASNAGTYTLPKIVIPWWNTVTNRYQEAILPEKTITVAINDDFNTATSSTNKIGTTTSSTNIPQNNSNSDTAKNTNIATQTSVKKSPFLQWLFLVLWLGTSMAWFISSHLKKSPRLKSKIMKCDESIDYGYLALLKYCKTNQGDAALQCIVPWVNSLVLNKKSIFTIEEAVCLINQDEFTQAINQLQQCYYGNGDKTWQGNELLHCLKKINKQQQKSKTKQLDKNHRNKINLNP